MIAQARTRFLDWKSYGLIVSTLLLISVGLVVVASADQSGGGSMWHRQLMWVGIGVVVALVAIVLDYSLFLKASYVFYFLAVAVLVYTELHGRTVSGAKSWITVPGLGMRFQPSEFAKLAIVLVLANTLAKKEGQIRGLRDMVIPLILVAIPGLLIVKQPDLGTAIVLAPITLGMLYVAGMPWVYLVFFFAPVGAFLSLADGAWATLLWMGGLAVLYLLMRQHRISFFDRFAFFGLYIASYISMPMLWDHLKPHQKSRFLVFWNPTYELDGAGYNLYQSKIAIGSGGFLGKGFAKGTQSQLNFLPESHTDFTFSVLAEEWGFLGCGLLFVLFLALLSTCVQIARECRTFDGALLVMGVSTFLFTHFAINVGMAMGMLPVAGLPLSFISYGGSHLLICMIGLGLVLNVKLRRRL